MADELQAVLQETGLTLTADLYQGDSVISAGNAMAEVISGYYVGNAPAVAAGVYTVLMLSAGVIKASGVLVWDGSQEVSAIDLATRSSEVHARLGLSSTTPLESAPDRVSFGAVIMDVVDVDGTIVVTRQ